MIVGLLAAPYIAALLGFNEEQKHFLFLYSFIIAFSLAGTPTGILRLLNRYRTLALQGTLSAGSNYTITFVSADLSITVKGITITANNQSEVVGDPAPDFTFIAFCFVGAVTFVSDPT